MRINSDISGLETLIEKLAAAVDRFETAMEDTCSKIGERVVQGLETAAPKGPGGEPPVGDGPGPLSQSFTSMASPSGCEVVTSQGTKLGYVKYGTGIFGPIGRRIYPVSANALYWEGADHPYRSVAGQKPNDFVTPVLDGASDIVAEELEASFSSFSVELE